MQLFLITMVNRYFPGLKIGTCVFVVVVAFYLCCLENVYPQAMVAGQHGPGNYFYDINPDTTLTGPYWHLQPLPAAEYDIDIDGDGTFDFFLHATGSWANGGGWQEISINSYQSGKYQIAFDADDTCGLISNYFIVHMAKAFRQGDLIGGSLDWKPDSSCYLSYHSWTVTPVVCSMNDFLYDSGDKFIGVRRVTESDTAYGWINVTCADFQTYTVREFAFWKQSTGMDDLAAMIKIYPVPTSGVLTIETPADGFSLSVYNAYGVLAGERTSLDTKSRFDLQGWAPGFYLFKFKYGKTVVLRKVILN